MVTRRADDVGQSWRVMMTVSSVSSADDEDGKNGKNVENTSKTRERPRLTPGWAFLNASGAIEGLFLVQRVPRLPHRRRVSRYGSATHLFVLGVQRLMAVRHLPGDHLIRVERLSEDRQALVHVDGTRAERGAAHP